MNIKLVVVTAAMLLMPTSFVFADAPPFHQKPSINKEVKDELLEQGYSKKEILIANRIAEKSEQSIEDILAFYSKTKSWEETTEHFNVKLHHSEHFEKNKEELEKLLSHYTGLSNEKVDEYAKKYSLRTFTKAAILSKLTEQTIDEILKSDKSFKELIEKYQIEQSQVKEEFKKIRSAIKD